MNISYVYLESSTTLHTYLHAAPNLLFSVADCQGSVSFRNLIRETTQAFDVIEVLECSKIRVSS